MATPEEGYYLHEDAFKRFSAGNRSLKYLSEYMMERARVEMDYSISLEDLAARWNKKLAETLDFEYNDFRTVLRDVFNEPATKAPLFNRVAHKIHIEATMLKKQHKDHFKREAQHAIVKMYHDAVEKQTRLEDKAHKAKKRYYRKKNALESVQNTMEEFPYRSESSAKYQELQRKKSDLYSQATDAYLRFETRLKVESMNRRSFLQEMKECQETYDERELYRLHSVRDRLSAMIKHLQLVAASGSYQYQEKLVTLQRTVKDFPFNDAIQAYTSQFMNEHIFPKFEDYQNHGVMTVEPSERTLDGACDSRLTMADSNRDFEATDSPYERAPQVESSFGSPRRSPVIAWEPPGSDENSENGGADPRDCTRPSNEHQGDSEEESDRDLNPIPANNPDDVTNLTNVRVVSKCSYVGRRSTELSFRAGQVIKQKLPANKEGWAFGWIRPNNFSKRRYGIYPAHFVELMSNTQLHH